MKIDSKFKSMDPTNKFALITGASSGIGKAFAIKLADQGYDLILTARREELLLELSKELEKTYHIHTIIVVADLSTNDGIDLVLAEIKNHNNIFFLINNAGFAILGKFEEIPWTKHKNMLSVHINAPTRLTYAVLPKMLENDEGVIINVSSVAAFISRRSLYGPTKTYLVSFTKMLKTRLKGSNIIVQALCPGYTYSGFHKTEEYEGKDPYSKIPKLAWMTSEKVVDVSMKALKKKKTVVITSFRYKLFIKLINWGLIKVS